MSAIPWILISIAVVIILLGILAIVVSKRNKRPVDYYNLFIIGITWLAIGVPLKNPALWILGVVFTITGLVNRKKWKKNRSRWDDLNKKEKKIRLWIMFILGLLVLLGLVLYVLSARNII